MQNNPSKRIDLSLKNITVEDLDFEKMDGLIPVIAQDINSGSVLMLAYANLNAIKKTQETGFAHYWSRSRKVIWKKGEASGNLQKIIEIIVDCDRDTLIYKVIQKGPACHTGERNCFFSLLLDKEQK